MFNKMTSILNWLCDFTLQVFDVEHYLQFKCSAIRVLYIATLII